MALYLDKAFKIMVKTYPFVILRAVLIILFAIGALAYLAFFIWLALKFGTIMTIIIVLISIAILWYIWRIFSRYVLYLYKAAHIAVIAELAEGRDIPSFTEQLKFGVGKVKERFLSVSALYVIDELINAVLAGFDRWVRGFAAKIPIPQLQSVFQFVARVISLAISYIDEAIVCYIFIKDKQDAWVSARDGLVLYAKNWKGILITSTILVSISYALSFGILTLANAVGTPLASIFPGSIAKEMVMVVALIIAFILYSAILSPFALCAIIVTYLEEIKDDTPDSETMDFLSGISDKFKELKNKIAWGGSAQAQPQPVANV